MEENSASLLPYFGWLIALGCWGISNRKTLRHWKRELKPNNIQFFEHKPYGTNARSPVPWAFYLYACLSQFSPVGAITRLASAKNSLRYIDSYILIWGVLVFLALYMPNQIGFFVPLFIWRFFEYTSIIIYQRFFGAGHPKRMEKDADPFRLDYRVLLVDVINYIIFAVMFAAYYHANGELVKPNPITSAGEAFYFSILTMATVAYGDFQPTGVLRPIVMLQVLFGIFMIVIIIGVLIGQRELFVRRKELSKEFLEKLKWARLFVMDFEGIHTDGSVSIDQRGEEIIHCSRLDDMGLELLRRKLIDINLCVISRGVNPAVSARCEKLELNCYQAINAREDKLGILKRAMDDTRATPETTIYMGDEVVDIECLEYVSLPVTVPSAHPLVRKVSSYVTKAPGGKGAIREICELILRARGKPLTLDFLD